jgi:hypothetical protein
MMIKRFVSNALLSLVMDKSAREKLHRAQDAKAKTAPAAPPSRETAPAAPAHPDASVRGVRVRSPQSVSAPGAPPAAAPSRAADADDPLAVIEQAIAEARRSLGMDPPQAGASEVGAARRAAKAHPAGKTGAAPADREALIAQALSIHSQKSQMLDELDDDARDKLRLMAIKALDPEAFEKIQAQALGDRPRKRKR